METLAGLPQYDWVVLTSPASARCFASVLRNAGFDLRRMPKIMVSGPGTAAELSAGLGLYADLVPPENFSADALIEAARPVLNHGAKILRLRSDKAGLALSTALEACGGAVTDCVLYSHEPVIYPGKPDFDAVFFASASAVEAFVAQWGAVSLEGTTVVALGAPTAAALSASGIRVDVQSPEATVADALNALAAYWVNARLANDAKEES
jgi:uroporphyrinogen-III synthase